MNCSAVKSRQHHGTRCPRQPVIGVIAEKIFFECLGDSKLGYLLGKKNAVGFIVDFAIGGLE